MRAETNRKPYPQQQIYHPRIVLVSALQVLLFFASLGTAFVVVDNQQKVLSFSGHRQASSSLSASAAQEDASDSPSLSSTAGAKNDKFDLSAALFCGGLAFDAYVEPPENSSRWERGSSGVNVAFLSPSYTRQLYKGLIKVTPKKCTNLPEDDRRDAGKNAVDNILTGKGVDAAILVAAIEGSWKEDVQLLEREFYHEGVLGLSGAAHVGRSSTCWCNFREASSRKQREVTGKGHPYYVKGNWMMQKGGDAVWPAEDGECFYLYVQDPATVRLVVTILDDQKLGGGVPLGSTYKKLSDLIPSTGYDSNQLVEKLKQEAAERVIRAQGSNETEAAVENIDKLKIDVAQKWEGVLPLTSKPRKRDKQGQIMGAAAAGAMVAGPLGAATGAVIGSFWEGLVQGNVEISLEYLPFLSNTAERKKYVAKGGMPGIDWGDLYKRHRSKQQQHAGGEESEQVQQQSTSLLAGGVDDLEHCFTISHDRTGSTCAVYRSVERKLIVVSFRGTCEPVDLVTDASFLQDAWAQQGTVKKDGTELNAGTDLDDPNLPKVHRGFRASLQSISRRLKELLLAVPNYQAGESLADYDLIVTGHSLGGALSTLFVADVGEYGCDAGRGLPQTQPSEPWWKSVGGIFSKKNDSNKNDKDGGPPRPKSLRMYNFGCPRVGNQAFAGLFDSLLESGRVDQAFRIVNGDDLVARFPRSLDGLVLGKVSYEHCGPTVLIAQPKKNEKNADATTALPIWIEGENEDERCPVRDGVTLVNPTNEGSLLSDLANATSRVFEKDTEVSDGGGIFAKLSVAARQVTNRLSTATSTDVASILGVDRDFTERELNIAKSIFDGKALAHHMEDEYYAGMGRASGFVAKKGKDLVEL